MAGFSYYVRDDGGSNIGTATGDGGRYGTQKTGTWASSFSATSEYYVSLNAALGATTAPTTGDIIFVAVDHDHEYNVGGSTDIDASQSGIPVIVVSVSVSNVDQYSKGAHEKTLAQAGADFRFFGRMLFQGLEFSPEDNFTIGGGSSGDKAQLIFRDCILNLQGANDNISISTPDGCHLELINTDMSFGANSCFISFRGGGTFKWMGGAITGAATAVSFLFNDGPNGIAAAGGMTACIKEVNLSKVVGILGGVGANASADDMIDIELHNCATGAGLTKSEETLENFNHSVRLYGCSDTSGGAELSFSETGYFGSIEQDTGVSRDESQAFDGGTRASIEAISSANTSTTAPLHFDLPIRFTELSQAASDTIEVFLTSDTVLTDTDVFVDVLYPDGTNGNIFNLASSINADVLAPGTTLTTDGSSTWTGAKTNTYIISVDTSGDVGGDGIPATVRICIARPSTTVYFDVIAGLS